MADQNILAQIEAARAEGYSDEEIAAYLVDQQLLDPNQEFYSATDAIEQAIEADKPTAGSALGRKLGLAGRAIIRGASGVPLMVQEGARSAVNLPFALAGQEVPFKRSAYDIQEAGMSAMGLPEPTGPGEKTLYELMQIPASIAPFGALQKVSDVSSKATSAAAQPKLTEALSRFFADKPGAQATAAGAAVLAPRVAESQFGVENPWALGAIGLGAGMVSPQGRAVTTEPAGRLAGAVVRPFTEEGRQAVAGSVLRQLSADPEAALARIEDAPTMSLIPGAKMSTPEVTKDLGLIGAMGPMFKTLDQNNTQGLMVSQRNTARLTELQRMARDPATVAKAEAKLEKQTGPMREQAFEKAKGLDPKTFQSGVTLAVQPVIDKIAAGPSGARADVETALTWAKKRLESGTTPERLYEVRKDLRAATQGKYNTEVPSLRLAKSELNKIVDAIDDTLESSAPGYRAYIDRYKKLSTGIDQMKELQDLQARSVSTAVDPLTQLDLFAPGKLVNNVKALLGDDTSRLSKTQKAALGRIAQDVQSGQSVVTSGVARAPGSDTMKNFSTANLIGRVIGAKVYGVDAQAVLPRSMALPMAWLYKLPDEKIAQLLVEAMADPILYRDLVRKATEITVVPLNKRLKAKAVESGIVTPQSLLASEE